MRFLTQLATLFLLLLTMWLAGCRPAAVPTSPSRAATALPTLPTLPALPAATATPARLPTATTLPPSPTPVPTTLPPSPTPTPPPLCQAPPLPGSGRRCYTTTSGHDPFIHPLALALSDDGRAAYLLDSGRVLALSLDAALPPTLLLTPGETIDGRRVLEPLDLALVPGGLVVLDRAGDVYFYDEAQKNWSVERPDRAIDDTSSHYYVALAAAGDSRYLLETSYSYGLRYLPQGDEFGWPLPEANLVDLAVSRSDGVSTAHVLFRPLSAGETAGVIRYVQGEQDRRFKARVDIDRPRALQLAGERLYLLDQGGSRLSALEASSGLLLDEWRLPFPASAAAITAGGEVVLAGRNALYFLDRPERAADIPAGAISLPFPQPHDPDLRAQLPPLVRPIPNLAVAERDLRLPGAPRHYRFGIHEGADFYWGPGREVRAVAAGVVIRATHDYVVPDPAAFAAWRAEAQELTYTSPAALDFFRGRQIWLEHPEGFITRYVHLSAIEPAVQVGVEVAQGEIIGQVGNSGSPAMLENDSADAHLHFELWFGENGYLGQFLRPIEIRELFETLFVD